MRDAYAEESERVGYRGFLVETAGPDVRARGRGPGEGVGRDRARTCSTRRRPTRRTRRRASTRRRACEAETVDDLQASPQFVVGTPAEVRARLEQVPADGSITFSPLAGGLPPDLAWASLELFASEVLPHL